MIRHLVLFRINGPLSAAERHARRQAIVALFSPLVDEIAYIRHWEVYANEAENFADFDVAINSVFDSYHDLRQYQIHEAHQRAVEANKGLSDSKTIFDFTLQ